MTLLDRVRRTIDRHRLAVPDTGVVAAVSGGSDSVALAVLLRELAIGGELRLLGLAHFNHQLRPESGRDEQVSGDLAGSLGVGFLTDREDVGALARAAKRSVEHAARVARYEFFERARRHFRADVVATGHTRDDQAETFLLRLVRGAGARGLAAIHPKRGTVVRPIIDCRRAELRQYLEDHGFSYVHDATNEDVSIPRNRVRAELLPLIERRFNPGIVDALADAADVARDEWLWLSMAAADAMAEIARKESGSIRLDTAGLERLPLALKRSVVWAALNETAGGRPIAFAHVETVMDLLEGAEGPVDLPGQRVQRVGAEIVLESDSDVGADGEPGEPYWYPLAVPGEAIVPEARAVVSAASAASWTMGPAGPTVETGSGIGDAVHPGMVEAVVRMPGSNTLAVRGWRAGDRFRPFGLHGRKKLQDYFVDRKVPRAERWRVPLVVDESDQIVWVAGHGVSEDFRVTDPAQPVLVLRLKPLGGLT